MFYVPSFSDSKIKENKENIKRNEKGRIIIITKKSKKKNTKGVPPETAQKMILDFKSLGTRN